MASLLLPPYTFSKDDSRRDYLSFVEREGERGREEGFFFSFFSKCFSALSDGSEGGMEDSELKDGREVP